VCGGRWRRRRKRRQTERKNRYNKLIMNRIRWYGQV
jgi:hypothetical protein